jgi:internalin A
VKFLKHDKTVNIFLVFIFLSLSAVAKNLSVEESHQKIAEIVAAKLNKATSDLTEQDYTKITYLNLEGLGLSDNYISDLSPLAKISITKIAFHNNKVKDISPLANNNKLAVVYFRNNLVSDLNPLYTPKFKRAVLTGNPVGDDQIPSKYKKKLQYKLLSKEESVAVLEKILRDKIGKPSGEITQEDCNGISSLSLTAMGLTDISPLKKCRNLTLLNLHMNEVTDVTPLAGMIKLTTLNLGSNMIKDISPLKDLVNLKTFIIYMNHIEDISIVANMKELHFLSAYENNIKVVKYVGHMKTARRIKFHDNPVPFAAQEECHKMVPDVELFFKTENGNNYYTATNKKKSK